MKQAKRKSTLILPIIIAVALVVAIFQTAMIVTVAKVARKNIVKDNSAIYDQLVDCSAVTIANMAEGTFKELDFYVNADIMDSNDENQKVRWLRQHANKRASDFSYVMYAEADGIAYTDIGTQLNASTRHYFKAIMKDGKDRFIGDPIVSSTTKIPVVHVARAVKRNGKTVGMIAGVIDLDRFTQSLEYVRIGETGYVWLLGSNGTVIFHPNKDFVMQKNFINGLGEGFEEIAEVATNISQGKTDSAWVKGLNGKQEYITYHPIDGTTWGLAMSVPQVEFTRLVDKIRFTLIGFADSVIIIVLLIVIPVLVHQIKPLKTVEKTITGIASGNADLTQRININSTNEVGRVVQGFNNFTEKLQNIISEVKTSKNDLSVAGELMKDAAVDTASSITEITSNIQSMHQQISSQSESVQRTVNAVNQIAFSMNSFESMITSQSADVTQASAAVEQMIGNISSVNQSVDKMAYSFDSLAQTAHTGFTKQEDVNNRIQQIKAQSAMLQEANQAIAAIAEQTNLLAMNAAIEAAHAGEAGKGFSVVADEIRKLSETSTEQSKTIGDQLSNIGEAINTVVNASDESSQAFKSVSTKISETEQLVLQIKSALEEQNEGSKQISESLRNMNDATMQVRNASNQMQEHNKAILNEVDSLSKATQNMKSGMDEMAIGASKINQTGVQLKDISDKVEDSIVKIGEQIDQFKV